MEEGAACDRNVVLQVMFLDTFYAMSSGALNATGTSWKSRIVGYACVAEWLSQRIPVLQSSSLWN
jgi:hypothetical protein